MNVSIQERHYVHNGHPRYALRLRREPWNWSYVWHSRNTRYVSSRVLRDAALAEHVETRFRADFATHLTCTLLNRGYAKPWSRTDAVTLLDRPTLSQGRPYVGKWRGRRRERPQRVYMGIYIRSGVRLHTSRAL